MIFNNQRKVRVDLRDAGQFTDRVRRLLRLGRRDFNVCFIADSEMARLNAAYRKKRRATDVLSFPWQNEGRGVARASESEFAHFLGDVVISPQTAQRNARAEHHSIREEIHWLILHGVLHLMGYDHETDSGEMTTKELTLRDLLNSGTRAVRLGASGVFVRRRGMRDRHHSAKAGRHRP